MESKKYPKNLALHRWLSWVPKRLQWLAPLQCVNFFLSMEKE